MPTYAPAVVWAAHYRVAAVNLTTWVLFTQINTAEVEDDCVVNLHHRAQHFSFLLAVRSTFNSSGRSRQRERKIKTQLDIHP